MPLFFANPQQTATTDPSNANDVPHGSFVGQKWINTATLNEWTCVSAGTGAAVWRHTPRILGQGNAIVVPVDTTEDVLATITVQANAMGANGAISIFNSWSYTNSANAKTMRIRFSGAGGTQVLAFGATTTTMYSDIHVIANQNATNVQAFHDRGSASGLSTTTGTNNAASIDTTAATTIVISGQKALNSETMTLLTYIATLTRPDIT